VRLRRWTATQEHHRGLYSHVSVMDKRFVGVGYRQLVSHFVVWSENNNFFLNTYKTKEMRWESDISQTQCGGGLYDLDNRIGWKCYNKSLVESAICFATVYRERSIRASDSKKFNKLIKKAGPVLRTALERLKLIVQRRMQHKLQKIMDKMSHIIHITVMKKVYSVRGFFHFAATKNRTGGQCCHQR